MKKELLLIFLFAILLYGCKGDEVVIRDGVDLEYITIENDSIPNAIPIIDHESKSIKNNQFVAKEAEVFVELDKAIRTGIVNYEDNIYFASGKNYYAYNVDTKKLVWTYTTEDSNYSVASIVGNRIIFSASDTLYCLDVNTGEEIFKFTHNSIGSTKGISSLSYVFVETNPKVHNDIIYYSVLDGTIIAVDLQTGNKIFEIVPELPGAIVSGIEYYNGYIYYLDCGGNLRAADALTGKMKFKSEIWDNTYSSMTISDGKVFVGGRSARFYCIDALTGEVIWNVSPYLAGSWYSGGSIVYDGNVYALTSDAINVQVINIESGETVKTYYAFSNAYTAPILEESNMIMVSTDVYNLDKSYVLSFDLDTDSLLWRTKISDVSFTKPCVVKGKVFIGSDSGTIYTIDK